MKLNWDNILEGAVNEMVDQSDWDLIIDEIVSNFTQKYQSEPTDKQKDIIRENIRKRITRALNDWYGANDYIKLVALFLDKPYAPFFDYIQGELTQDHPENVHGRTIGLYRGLTFDTTSKWYDTIKNKKKGDLLDVDTSIKRLQSWSINLNKARSFGSSQRKGTIGVVLYYEFDLDDVVMYYDAIKTDVYSHSYHDEKEAIMDMDVGIQAEIIEAYVGDGGKAVEVTKEGVTIAEFMEEHLPLTRDEIYQQFVNGGMSLEKMFDNIQKNWRGDEHRIMRDWVLHSLSFMYQLWKQMTPTLLKEVVAPALDLKMLSMSLDNLAEDKPRPQYRPSEDVLKEMYELCADKMVDEDYKSFKQMMIKQYGMNPDAGDYDVDSGGLIEPTFYNTRKKEPQTHGQTALQGIYGVKLYVTVNIMHDEFDYYKHATDYYSEFLKQIQGRWPIVKSIVPDIKFGGSVDKKVKIDPKHLFVMSLDKNNKTTGNRLDVTNKNKQFLEDAALQALLRVLYPKDVETTPAPEDKKKPGVQNLGPLGPMVPTEFDYAENGYNLEIGYNINIGKDRLVYLKDNHNVILEAKDAFHSFVRQKIMNDPYWKKDVSGIEFGKYQTFSDDGDDVTIKQYDGYHHGKKEIDDVKNPSLRKFLQEARTEFLNWLDAKMDNASADMGDTNQEEDYDILPNENEYNFSKVSDPPYYKPTGDFDMTIKYKLEWKGIGIGQWSSNSFHSAMEKFRTWAVYNIESKFSGRAHTVDVQPDDKSGNIMSSDFKASRNQVVVTSVDELEITTGKTFEMPLNHGAAKVIQTILNNVMRDVLRKAE